LVCQAEFEIIFYANLIQLSERRHP